MYISSFLTLDTALSGVEAAQEQLDTTGENITNENTAGYEEQTVNLSESQSLDVAGTGNDGALQLGTGVTAASITNSGDPYLDAAWRQQNATTNAASTSEGFLNQIQSALNEPNGTSSISSELSSFWSDWNDLADNPSDTAAQQAVVEQGQSVASAFNSLSSEINGSDPSDPTAAANSSSILGQVNSQYEDTMEGPTGAGASGGTLYNDAYNIAQLNYSIVQAQAAGQSANDLIDQRNAALDNLSQLGNTQVQNNSDGSVTVYFGGVVPTTVPPGPALISDPTSGTPDGAVPPGDNFGSYSTGGTDTGSGWAAAFQTQYANAATADTSAASLATTVGGTIGSLIGLAGYSSSGFGNLGTPTYSASTGITSYASATSATPAPPATWPGTIGTISASLDQVASDLAAEVNTPAVSGGSSGETVTTEPPFFLSSDGTSDITAATLSVNPTLVSTPTDLQVSTEGDSVPASNASDNDVALDEANNSGGTADTAYEAFVQQVGSLAQGATNADSTASALQTQITNQRTSVEGVDLSQEMANLINEQQAYQASAKVMNAFSTVMDSLMTVVGQ